MKFNTPLNVFLLAAFPSLIAEGMRYIGGAYDWLPTQKLVVVALVALATAAVQGLLGIKALGTEPKSASSDSPPSP